MRRPGAAVVWRQCGGPHLTGMNDKSLVSDHIRRKCGGVAVWHARRFRVGGGAFF